MLLLGAMAAIGVAGAVATLGERGAFAPRSAGMMLGTIPGMTVADGGTDAALPVVTSLRSDGEAERLGVRVGDRIAAVDDRPVSDSAGVDRAIRERSAAGPVALHIRRGDAIWTVAIDRGETVSRTTSPHDPQDPAG